MSTCKKCGNPIPYRFLIDGIWRIASSRRHCLSCNPFGQTMKRVMDGNCTCSVCGRHYTYNRSKGHTRTKCGTCSCNQRRFDVKNRAVAYKGGKCQLCGYKKCTRALKFHHNDETKKKFSLGGNHGRSWESIERELDKCMLVCGNCHDEIHAGLVTAKPGVTQCSVGAL